MCLLLGSHYEQGSINEVLFHYEFGFEFWVLLSKVVNGVNLRFFGFFPVLVKHRLKVCFLFIAS